MTVHLFCGPTLPLELATELLPDAVVHGPAGWGDVYRACRAKASAIGIIDGYFDHRLSIWHKEILWALSIGIPVYGAASMGALRASELAPFGMTGIGVIYQQYQTGELEDDDEVAVVHESADRAYRTTTQALVNIRATLRAAVVSGLLQSEEESEIIRASKAQFYADRGFRAAVDGAHGIAASKRASLIGWYERRGIVDQKRSDAIEMVKTMGDPTCDRLTTPTFHFEETNYWRVFVSKVESDASFGETTAAERLDLSPWDFDNAGLSASNEGLSLLNALRDVDSALCNEVTQAALRRALALLVAPAAARSMDSSALQTESEEFRRKRGLLTPGGTSQWLNENDLSVARFSALMRDELIARRYGDIAWNLVLQQVPDVLRTLGRYRMIQSRVEAD